MRCLLLVPKNSNGMCNHWQDSFHGGKGTGNRADLSDARPLSPFQFSPLKKGDIARGEESLYTFLIAAFDSRFEQSKLRFTYVQFPADLILALLLQVESCQDLTIPL